MLRTNHLSIYLSHYRLWASSLLALTPSIMQNVGAKAKCLLCYDSHVRHTSSHISFFPPKLLLVLLYKQNFCYYIYYYKQCSESVINKQIRFVQVPAVHFVSPWCQPLRFWLGGKSSSIWSINVSGTRTMGANYQVSYLSIFHWKLTRRKSFHQNAPFLSFPVALIWPSRLTGC